MEDRYAEVIEREMNDEDEESSEEEDNQNLEDELDKPLTEEDIRKMQEYEQNYILTPLWEALTNIKTPRQAINAAMGMLITAKDILVLELGKDVAKTTVDITVNAPSAAQTPQGSRLTRRERWGGKIRSR